MADISTYLKAINDAIYGEEVRSSIHDAINIINEVAQGAKDSATASATAAASNYATAQYAFVEDSPEYDSITLKSSSTSYTAMVYGII